MNEFTQYSAKTVDDAITKALIDLGITSADLEYEVVEKGSTGILGIFNAKPAIIKARKKYVQTPEGQAVESTTSLANRPLTSDVIMRQSPKPRGSKRG